MTSTGRLERGDFVRVRSKGSTEWARAFVGLASSTDPASVMLILNSEDCVRPQSGGLIVGSLPLTVYYAEERIEGAVGGGEYDLEVASMQATYSPEGE